MNQAMISTTMVRIAVLKSESISLMPILARMDVSPANTADRNANSSQDSMAERYRDIGITLSPMRPSVLRGIGEAAGSEHPAAWFSSEMFRGLFDRRIVKNDVGDCRHYASDVLVLEDVPSDGYAVTSRLQ